MLEFRDANNLVTFDSTSMCFKILGFIGFGRDYTGTQTSGTIVDGRLTAYAQQTPRHARTDGLYTDIENDVYIRFEGNSLIWQFPAPPVIVGGVITNRPNWEGVYGLV